MLLSNTLIPVPFRASVATFINVLVEVEKLNPSLNYVLKRCGREEYFFEDNLILPNYQVWSK